MAACHFSVHILKMAANALTKTKSSVFRQVGPTGSIVKMLASNYTFSRVLRQCMRDYVPVWRVSLWRAVLRDAIPVWCVSLSLFLSI